MSLLALQLDVPDLTAAVREQTVALNRIVAILERMNRPARPGHFQTLVIGEPMPGIMQFKVQLPANPDVDTHHRELTVDFADGTQRVFDAIAPDAAELVDPDLKGPQDSTVTLTLVDVDDANNRSAPRVETATLADTIAPAQPGEFAAVITGEE